MDASAAPARQRDADRRCRWRSRPPSRSGSSGRPSTFGAGTEPAPRIDLRVLLLSATGKEPSFGASKAQLTREGVPFDAKVADGTVSCPSALADGEWAALEKFEATFGIRRFRRAACWSATGSSRSARCCSASPSRWDAGAGRWALGALAAGIGAEAVALAAALPAVSGGRLIVGASVVVACALPAAAATLGRPATTLATTMGSR
jgi:hypothetical protein